VRRNSSRSAHDLQRVATRKVAAERRRHHACRRRDR
jgi:hypothetical protein